MCYTAHASSFSFVVNLIGSVALWMFDPALGAFHMFVGIMQLYDFVFWTFHGRNAVNYAVTKLAMISNHAQPLALAALIWCFKGPLRPASAALLVAYSAVVLAYTADSWNRVRYTVVHAKSYPSLYWEWNDQRGGALVYGLFVVCVASLFWQHFPAPVNGVLGATTIASFVLSWYYYKGRTVVGRFWCYYAAFIPLFLAVISWAQRLP